MPRRRRSRRWACRKRRCGIRGPARPRASRGNRPDRERRKGYRRREAARISRAAREELPPQSLLHARPLDRSVAVNFFRFIPVFCERGSRVLPRCAVPAIALTASIDGQEPRKAGPFVKWAGGKTSLLAELHKHVPARLRGYHEPFVGGGALFFSLRPRRAFLADSNGELIHTYQQVRDQVCGVLDALSLHVYERSHFERVRALDPVELPPSERAARFIYLNKTCFNGLWRVNRAGRFNVPFGRYKAPTFLDPGALIRASQALKGAQIQHAPFELP